MEAVLNESPMLMKPRDYGVLVSKCVVHVGVWRPAAKMTPQALGSEHSAAHSRQLRCPRCSGPGCATMEGASVRVHLDACAWRDNLPMACAWPQAPPVQSVLMPSSQAARPVLWVRSQSSRRAPALVVLLPSDQVAPPAPWVLLLSSREVPEPLESQPRNPPGGPISRRPRPEASTSMLPQPASSGVPILPLLIQALSMGVGSLGVAPVHAARTATDGPASQDVHYGNSWLELQGLQAGP